MSRIHAINLASLTSFALDPVDAAGRHTLRGRAICALVRGQRVRYAISMSIIDPVDLAQSLIRCPSVTPEEAGALDLLESVLADLGFDVSRVTFSDPQSADVENLYARIGSQGPNFCFAGHTDVVPAGRVQAWSADPFAATINEGRLIGRGAADMKGAIAAFVAAAATYLADEDRPARSGSLSLLITGDEEGPAINGTRKMLDWLKGRGQSISHCLVGEPTNPDSMGEMVKVGRRGSINCFVTIHGTQGHVAYPDRARNPLHALPVFLSALTDQALDSGYPFFQPSSLQVTEIETDNPAHNMIPGDVRFRLNVRFNPHWTGDAVAEWIDNRLSEARDRTDFSYEFLPIISGEAFLTEDQTYLDMLADSIERQTGRRPEFSTSGGTSDARFIQAHAPVAEFGLVGATMHKIDEQVAVSDISLLRDIYTDILYAYFDRYGH